MDWDREYSNGAFIAGGADFPPRWEADAAAFRARRGSAGTHLGVAYGRGERQRCDLFLPQGTPRGTVVFVHGGYWKQFGRETWSHLAAGPLAQGWAVALPSYTLAPQARIGAMTREIAAALAMVADRVPGPLVVAGHSAGGHLAARMACADIGLPAALTGRLRRILPISPVADLVPLMATAMNATLCIDAAEAAAESPSALARRAGCEVTVWVGGQERPAFLWQARTLSENWDCPWHVAPGRHHFDVIEDLCDPASLLVRTLIGEG